MSEVDIAIRAGEIALSAGSALVRLISAALEKDADEEKALREALTTLAARPDLKPCLPQVRAMLARERDRIEHEERAARSEDDTSRVTLPGAR